MKRTNVRAALLALALTGCALYALNQATTEDEIEHVAGPDHNCACYPNRTTKQWFMCDETGSQNSEGPYMCCGAKKPDGSVCGMQCARMGKAESKPPVPVPLPPRCDADTHCKNQESCVVGDHKCCAACHQACF